MQKPQVEMSLYIMLCNGLIAKQTIIIRRRGGKVAINNRLKI